MIGIWKWNQSKSESQNGPCDVWQNNWKEKHQERYFEDILASASLTISVETTNKDREAKVRGSFNDPRAIIEDFILQASGRSL